LTSSAPGGGNPEQGLPAQTVQSQEPDPPERRELRDRGGGARVPQRAEVRDVAGYMADRFVHSLQLGYCVIYLYDEARENLVATAVRGEDRRHRDVIPLSGRTGFGEFEVTPGRCGTTFSLPLWDTRRLLGVVHGRLAPGRPLTGDILEIGHALSQGGALALSLALARGMGLPAAGEGAGPRAGAGRGSDVSAGCLDSWSGEEYPFGLPGGLNPMLVGYLEARLEEATAGPPPVSVVLMRLTGPGARGRLPTRGRDIAPPDGVATGRGFALAPNSTELALVWPGVGREGAGGALHSLARGRLALDEVVGRLPEGGSEAPVRFKSAALAVFPEDAGDAASLLAVAGDFLDAATYLASAETLEGRETETQLTGAPTAGLMDSRILSAEIDRLRQVLAELIAGGEGASSGEFADLNQRFQEPTIRDISERLDRLIVVMQRYMSHRGART